MPFAGYLMRKPGTSTYFPEQYIVWGSYSTTPNRRQDKDPTRNLNGVLHRGVVAAKPTTIKFSVRDGLHLADKQAIQSFFSACTVNAAEKKVQIEFWDDENNTYKTEYMYLPDIAYPIMYHTSNDIVYGGIDFELIGYGN